jgi:hypothetical protein
MAAGDSTWDLSEKDCEALRTVLHEFKEASDKMLCCYCGKVTHKVEGGEGWRERMAAHLASHLVDCPTHPARIAIEMEAALVEFVSCVLSVRLKNTPEWMSGISEDVNKVCAVLRDHDRFTFDGDGLRKVKAPEVTHEG